MVEIDGSSGEGGGQVLRTALSLSVVTGKAFRIFDIRARRKVPGLRPQHLGCVRACAAISRGKVAGAVIGSKEIEFRPAGLFPGEYKLDVGTAGSAALVFQAVFLPLARAKGRSRLLVTGGTHVPWSPSFHYLRDVFLGTVPAAEATLKRAGYYPLGGGRIDAAFPGAFEPEAWFLAERGDLVGVKGLSYYSVLDRSVAERMRDSALELFREAGLRPEIELEEIPSRAPGCGLHIVVSFERSKAGFSSLGEKRKRAEIIGKEAAREALEFIESQGAVDPHLADQLLQPASVAGGESRFSTSRITRHLTTNAWVIEKFLDVSVEIRGEEGEPGEVTVRT